MKLSPVALAVTAAFVWGAAILIIGGVNSIVPDYGDAVLALVVSIYPGYEANGTPVDLLLGTAYAFFDGLAGGFVFAVMYNGVLRLTSPRQKVEPVEAIAPAAAPASEPAAEVD